MPEFTLGRRAPTSYEHVTRGLLKLAAPLVAERALDARFDVWSLADANQGNHNSCVGHSWSRCMTILNGRRYDPLALWNAAKDVDAWADTNSGDNNGTSCHAGASILIDRGHVPVVGGADQSWSLPDGIERAGWATDVDTLRAAVQMGAPIETGISWMTAYDTPRQKNGEWWIGLGDRGDERGGHAVPFRRVSDQRQAFLICPSWGDAYPEVWIPYSEVEWQLQNGAEMAIITDRPGPDITPTPTPKPKPGRIPKDAVSAHPLTLLSVLNQGATTVVLEDGVYFPLHLSQMSGIALYARHVGKVAFRSGVADDRGPSVGMKLDDCENIVVDGIGFANAGCGVRATDCRDLTFRRVFSHHHQVEGFLFGACDTVLLEDCEAWHCQGNYENEPGKSNPLYFSFRTKNAIARRFFGHECGGSCQSNGHEVESGGPNENILIEASRFRNCGIGGGAGINAASTDGLTVRKTQLTWDANCPEAGDLSADNAGGVACFAGDEGGSVRNAVLDGVTVKGAHRYGVQVLDGSVVTAKDCHVTAKQNVRDVDGSSTLTDGGGNTWEQA